MLKDLRRLSYKYFGQITILFFLLFATILCFRSVSKAKLEYGDKWQFYVYTNNPFQIELASKLQFRIHSWLQSHGIKGDEGAIIEAMTIGYKSELPKEVKNDFARAGASHILALSGFHVSIIYVILQIVFLSRIVQYKWRWTSQILVLLTLWIYAFIAGMSPSLVRAVIMCTVLTISKLHTHKFLTLRALLVAAIIMFLIEPLIVFHVGFQLSFVSMLGIHLLAIPLCEYYQGYTYIDRTIWSTIAITFTCTLFTLPIAAYTFGQMPLMGIFTNIIILPLTYALFFLMFIWSISLGASIIGEWLLSTSHYMLLVVRHVAHLPNSAISYKPSLLSVVAYYCLLAVVVIIANRTISKGKESMYENV